MVQNYPLSIFHAAVRPESSPGADLSTFQKVILSLFSGLFGSFRAQLFNFFIRRVVIHSEMGSKILKLNQISWF